MMKNINKTKAKEARKRIVNETDQILTKKKDGTEIVIIKSEKSAFLWHSMRNTRSS